MELHFQELVKMYANASRKERRNEVDLNLNMFCFFALGFPTHQNWREANRVSKWKKSSSLLKRDIEASTWGVGDDFPIGCGLFFDPKFNLGSVGETYWHFILF